MCFFKLIKVHLLVSELYIYQNARCNNKKRGQGIKLSVKRIIHKSEVWCHCTLFLNRMQYKALWLVPIALTAYKNITLSHRKVACLSKSTQHFSHQIIPLISRFILELKNLQSRSMKQLKLLGLQHVMEILVLLLFL